MKLLDVVTNLPAYNSELTIYATAPWMCDSEAVVTLEPDNGALPREVEAAGATYFLEVSIAKEFLQGWLAAEAASVSARDRCERLIRYAIDDA